MGRRHAPGVCISLDGGSANWIVLGGLMPCRSASSSSLLSHVISSLSSSLLFFISSSLRFAEKSGWPVPPPRGVVPPRGRGR